MTAEVRPTVTKGVLEPTTSTLAVRNGDVYDYYRIKAGDPRGDFVDLLKLPPVLMEGYVTYKGKLYPFSLRDFFRRRVNVGQSAYRPATSADATDDTSSSGDPIAVVTETITNPDQSGASNAFGLQEHEAANLAWQEQIDALQYLDDTEA